MSINHVCISGNLTRDAELRNSGKASVLRFSVAVNERRRNSQTDEWEDYPNYVDCVVFGNYAEAIADSMAKGAHVCVSGSLRYSTWESNGQKRSKLEVIAREIDLPPRRKQEPKHDFYADDILF